MPDDNYLHSQPRTSRPADSDVPVTPEAVGTELRRMRRARGETQADVARSIGVARANLAQWESGRYLPSMENAQLLDDHLRTGNLLVGLVHAARSPASAHAVARSTGGSLLDVFRRTGNSLAAHVIRDEHDRAVGWRHNLQQNSRSTPLATALALSAMAVVGQPYVDLQAVVDDLYSRRTEHGWKGRSDIRRPDVTSAVVDALTQVSTVVSADGGLGYLERSLDSYSRTRPFLLATALRTAVRLRPDAPLTRSLTDQLLSARIDFGGTPLWGEKKEPGLVLPEPSAVHTARAVVALRGLLRTDDRADVRDAVEVGTQWLIDRSHPDDARAEDLAVPQSDGRPSVRLMIRHFTAAWVLQALAEAPHVPVARLNRALGSLWERYEPSVGLWAWGSGDLPIGMTLDAVTALRAAALAFTVPALNPPAADRELR